MHVHGSPTVRPQEPVAPTPKPARPAASGADLHALTALSRDRNGSGSQPRQRRDERQPRAEPQAAVAAGPAATLAALLVTLDLDASASGQAAEMPLERLLRTGG